MDVKLGIIGLGGILQNHLLAIDVLPAFRLAGVCDADPQRCRQVADKFDVPGYADYRQLLQEDMDVVAVTLPHHLHARVTLDALSAGCHVMLEKPVAIQMADLRAISQAIEESGCHVITADTAYWLAVFQAARRIVQTRQLGEFAFGSFVNYRYYFHDGRPGWFLASQSSGGGQFCNIGVHRIAGVRCVLGEDLQERQVLASVQRMDEQYEIEAATSAMVRYEGGQAMTYEEVGYFKPPEELVKRDTHFVFEQGLLGLGADYVWTSDRQGRVIRHELAPEPEGGKYRPFYEQMLRAMQGESYYPDFALGARDVRVSLAAYASAREGKLIDLQDPDWQLGAICGTLEQE
jgi:predicted dehydrogenase